MPVIVVQELEQTCEGCPSQWEGRTTDGAHIYVRYRWGTLRIGVAATDMGAVAQAMGDAPAFVYVVGDSLDGWMDYETLKTLTLGAVVWP